MLKITKLALACFWSLSSFFALSAPNRTSPEGQETPVEEETHQSPTSDLDLLSEVPLDLLEIIIGFTSDIGSAENARTFYFSLAHSSAYQMN